MRRPAFAMACVLLLTSATWGGTGKDSSQWENLSTLQGGAKIQVIDTTHKKHSGTLSSVTSSAIMLHEKTRDETIQRENVLRVSGRSHRTRNALIGAAIGAAAGAATGAASDQCTSGCFGVTQARSTAALAGFGAIVGAVVGAIIPAHKTIYRAP